VSISAADGAGRARRFSTQALQGAFGLHLQQIPDLLEVAARKGPMPPDIPIESRVPKLNRIVVAISGAGPHSRISRCIGEQAG